LSKDTKAVGLVEFLGFRIETAGGLEVGELEAAAVGFDAFSEDF